MVQTQYTHVCMNKVINDQDTKADDAKSVKSDMTAFSQTDTIQNLQALKAQ